MKRLRDSPKDDMLSKLIINRNASPPLVAILLGEVDGRVCVVVGGGLYFRTAAKPPIHRDRRIDRIRYDRLFGTERSNKKRTLNALKIEARRRDEGKAISAVARVTTDRAARASCIMMD